jgi:hypothetical protein
MQSKRNQGRHNKQGETWNLKDQNPSSIKVSVELKWAGSREEQVLINSATKISKDVKEMIVVDTGGSGHELTQDVNGIRNVKTSDAKTDKTTDEVTIASGILKWNTICGTKTSVKLHKSVQRSDQWDLHDQEDHGCQVWMWPQSQESS